MKINGYEVGDEIVGGIINLLVIKSTWKIYKESAPRKKGESFYSSEIITRYNYQNALNERGIEYNTTVIEKMGIPNDILIGKTLFINDMDGTGDFEMLKSLRRKLCMYLIDKRNGEASRSTIQGCETTIRNYIKRQRQLFDEMPLRCSSPELRNLFRYFRNGDSLSQEYDLRLIEEGLNAITTKVFMDNIDNRNVLEEHANIVRKYLMKLQAVITLKEDLKNF